jgi:uncharacterized Zn finger protein
MFYMIGSYEERRNSRIFRPRVGPEPYRVSFKRNGTNLSAYCTCPAGENGMHCKHRIRILQGSAEGIVIGNVRDVARVAGWLAGTDVEVALRSVTSLEDEAAKIARALSAAKKALARCFLD